MKKSALAALISLLVFAVLAPSAIVSAQVARCPSGFDEIDYGSSADGTIDDDEFTQFFCFEGDDGDTFRIDVEITDGDLKTIVLLGYVPENDADNLDDYILDSAGARIAGSDIELNYTLPEDAAYLIIVTRDGVDTGRTDGSFIVTLTEQSVGSGGSGGKGGTKGGSKGGSGSTEDPAPSGDAPDVAGTWVGSVIVSIDDDTTVTYYRSLFLVQDGEEINGFDYMMCVDCIDGADGYAQASIEGTIDGDGTIVYDELELIDSAPRNSWQTCSDEQVLIYSDEEGTILVGINGCNESAQLTYLVRPDDFEEDAIPGLDGLSWREFSGLVCTMPDGEEVC